MNDKTPSPEQLQAFIDGQLDSVEKSYVLTAIKDNPDISRQACEYRTLSELVKIAYIEPPASEQNQPEPEHKSSRLRLTSAAMLLLAIGAGLGWFSHPTAKQNEDNTLNAMYWDDERAFNNSQLGTLTSQQTAKRIIVHLNTSSPKKFTEALITAEKLLKQYSDSDMGTEIEVVANASAIKMLRAGHTPYETKVRQLQEQYFNLTFLACKNAIDHTLELEGTGAKVELLPDVNITPSALEHILERLRDGWLYINV